MTNPRSEPLSPFDNERTTPDPKTRKRPNKIYLIVAGTFLAIVASTILGYYAFQNFADPLRTLEVFPGSQYLDNPQSLYGLRFRADVRADADLGWKEGVGRLMAFTVEGSSNPIAVFIPESLGNIYFTKGQNYLAEIEIKDGGLIHAISCQKN